MKTILTAEEVMQIHLDPHDCLRVSKCYNMTLDAMIEFAKMHVEAALKQAAHESQCYNKAKFSGDQNWVVDIDSILNSYSLDKIK